MDVGQQFIGIVGHVLLENVNDHVQKAMKLGEKYPPEVHYPEEEYPDDSMKNPNLLGYHLSMAGADKNRIIKLHNQGSYERAALYLDSLHDHLREAARAFDRKQKDEPNRTYNDIWDAAGEISRVADDYKNLVHKNPLKERPYEGGK